MQLVYSYTTKMGNYTDNEWVMIYYRASMRVAKKFGYRIKLYGCNYTCINLEDEVDEIVNIENEEFILTDDLKLWIHQRENLDCITIDGDLMLFNKLNLPNDCDVIFEVSGLVSSGSVDTKFNKYLDRFKKYNIDKIIPYFDYTGTTAYNVGILKFNNKEVKDLFISSYFEFRNYYLTHIEPHEGLIKFGDPAIILCEYNFARISEKKNINVKFARDTSSYKHYMSDEKFSQEFFNHVDNVFGNNNKII